MTIRGTDSNAGEISNLIITVFQLTVKFGLACYSAGPSNYTVWQLASGQRQSINVRGAFFGVAATVFLCCDQAREGLYRGFGSSPVKSPLFFVN